MTARLFGIRFSVAYAFLMIGGGVQLPFLPLWLNAKGFNVGQIAAVVAGMMAVRIVGAPLFASLADKTGNRLAVVRTCAVLAAAAYIVLAYVQDFEPILIVAMLAAWLFAPVFPIIEGYSVEGSAHHGLDYGRLRLWASLSFLSGSLASGFLLTLLPAQDTIYLIAGAQSLSALATFVLPPDHGQRKEEHHATALELRDALKFLFASRFTIFLAAASLSNCSHGMQYSFSSVLWSSYGFSTMTIGLLWACAVLAEVLLFSVSNRVVAAFGIYRLLCFGLTGAIVRWVGMAFVSDFAITAGLQMLHALSFASAHLALMHFIRLNVHPKLRNTAQGLYAALAGGLLLSSVTWASGPLYRDFGAKGYLAMALIASFGLGLALFSLAVSPKAPSTAAA
jgi:MFS transporter, PPP family, 3-phenylpropionic acid transporter